MTAQYIGHRLIGQKLIPVFTARDPLARTGEGGSLPNCPPSRPRLDTRRFPIALE
jgi:hypothetical protein